MNGRTSFTLILALFVCGQSFCAPIKANPQDNAIVLPCENGLTAKVIDLDLMAADGYAVTETDLLLKALRRLKLKLDNVLVRGFDGSLMEKILNEGSDRRSGNLTYAYTVAELNRNEKDGLDLSIFTIAHEYRIPAIAVYDRSQMVKAMLPFKYEFAFPGSKRSALLAVFLLH